MDERIPEIVRPLLDRYILRLNECLPGIMDGFYIVGSIALGGFNPDYSDIDFVAVITRGLTPPEIETLRNLHSEVEKSVPLWRMSGSYIRVEDLGKLDEIVATHIHYHDGSLRVQQRNELNAVTWWELKNHGIAIFGTQPQHLGFVVDWKTLLAWMMANMNSYWAGWAGHPARILMLHTDWGIQWAVTGVLRQFYTLREHDITTKVKAARYALGHLPVRWHGLIQDAINIRHGIRKSAYRFRIMRTLEAVRFLRFVIETCTIEYART